MCGKCEGMQTRAGAGAGRILWVESAGRWWEACKWPTESPTRKVDEHAGKRNARKLWQMLDKMEEDLLSIA